MSYTDEVLADSPVFFLPMSEQSGDFANLGSSGGAANVDSGISRGVMDRFGNPTAVTLSSGNYIRGTIPSGTWTDRLFTVEFWFNHTQSANTVTFASAGTNPGVAGSMVAMQTYYTRMRVGYGGAYWDLPEAMGVNDGQWHHMVIASWGTGFDYYLDGAFIVSKSRSATFNLTDQLWIGNANNRSVDDFAVYDYTLSAARILAHYQAAGPVMPYATKPGVFHGWSVPL